jgi:K+-sensing histidine kinase KdpD
MPSNIFWQLTAGFIGACVGGGLAFVLEIEGYSPLAIYMLLGSWLGAWVVAENDSGAIIDNAKYFRISQKKTTKALLVVLLTATYFGIEYAFDINPRSFVYLPLVPLVLASTLILGFEYGLMATILSAAIADYFYVPAIYSLKVEQWEDAVGLLAFVIAGSLLAFGISKIILPKR